MSAWIIEFAMMGRLTDEDWGAVRRRVRRMLARVNNRVRRRHPVLWRVLPFGYAMTMLALVIAGLQERSREFTALSLIAGGGVAFVMTSTYRFRAVFLRSLRHLRRNSPSLSLRARPSLRQRLELHLIQHTAASPALFGFAMLFGFWAERSSNSGWGAGLQITLALVAVAWAFTPIEHLWKSALFEQRVRQRRDMPARNGIPQRCLSCDHPTLIGSQEICTECGYPNILPQKLFPPPPRTSVDVD